MMESNDAAMQTLLEELADASDFKLCLQQYESLVNVAINQQTQALSHAQAIASSSRDSNFCDKRKPVVLKVEGREDNLKKRSKTVVDRRIFKSRSNTPKATDDPILSRPGEPGVKNINSDYYDTYAPGPVPDTSSHNQRSDSSSQELQQNFILLQDNSTSNHNGNTAGGDMPSFLIPISADFFNSTGVEQQFVEIKSEDINEVPDGDMLGQADVENRSESTSNTQVIHLTPDMQNQILALLGNQECSASDLGRIIFNNDNLEENGRSDGNSASHE